MKKILTIDDQRDNLITVEAVIKSQLKNSVCLSALSGIEGIEIARNEQPDVILLDIIMPQMDGYQVCEILKSNDKTKHIPVLMLTAIKTDSKSRIRGLETGADAFLSKPIDPSEFAAQVKVMLRIKEAEDGLRAKNESLEEIVSERTTELKESKEKYQALYENTPLPYQSLNSEGIIVAVNPAWLHTLNYTSDEVIGKWYGDFLHEDYQPIFKENFPKLKNCGAVEKVPFKIRHKNGQYIDISLDGISVYHPDGEFKQTYCVFQDVTERNKFETELKESEKKYKSLFNSIRDAILVADTERNIIDCNDAFSSLFGYSRDEIIGNKTSYCYETEEQYLALGKSIKENIDGLTSFFYTVNFKKKNNEIFQGETGLNYLTDQYGNISGFIGLIRDITDRLKSEQSLLMALEHATESDRLKSTFLATMSHELRTPLNAIIGFSELIDLNTSVELAANFAKTINTSGNQLLNIIDDLMDISLIESGEAKIRIQDVEVNSMLNHIHKIMQIEQQAMNKSGVELKMVLDTNISQLVIQSDPNKLKQIMINLLKNALKFTHRGTVSFGFELVNKSSQSFLKFFVSDTGIGISEQKQQSIFEVFVQLEDSKTRTYGGTGIGLSVAKKLTVLLGGDIWVESEEGKGSTFYFTLPYIHNIEAPSEFSLTCMQ
jgi:PAS domain S-box-containing protein